MKTYVIPSERSVVLVLRIAVISGIFLLWEYGAAQGWIDPAYTGKPSGIVQSLINGLFREGDVWRELGWTLSATFLAFTAGSAAAILFGMLFVLFPLIEKVLDPLLAACNAMPRIALAPLLIVWFGLGIGSKVAIGFSLTFFIVLQAAVAGGRSVNQDHVTLSRTLGLSPTKLFWKVTMPGAVPVMFAGLRLGLVAALLGVVGGEIIASERGLGQKVSYLAAAFDMNGVWSLLFILAAVGVLLSWMLDRLEERLLRWQ
jgi:NitT/TauT family transport system permease protein